MQTPAATPWPGKESPEPCSAVCSACTSVSNADVASDCLFRCGFAVWPQALNPASLQSALSVYNQWYGHEQSHVRQFLNYRGATGLRGRRVPVALPLPLQAPWPLSEVLTDDLLFSKPVIDSAVRTFEALGLGPAIALNFASFIHSMEGCDDQRWHQDSQQEDGLKVQVPLDDVGVESGPLQLSPLGCVNISIPSAQGTAIIYRHVTWHRGTANRARAARTVVDLSFGTPRGRCDGIGWYGARVGLALRRRLGIGGHRGARLGWLS